MIGVLPLYAGMIVHHFRSEQPLSTRAFVIYLAVISPLAIAVALLVLRFLCREHPRDLNLRRGGAPSDLLAGLILSVVILVANVVSNQVLSQLLPNPPTDTSVRDLFVKLAGNRGLAILFLGLLIPLGAASEEVIRVFLLSRLWKVWASITGRLVAVFISACLFGLIHGYRGPAGVAWTAVFGLIMALYYLRFGRVAPLIIAHYATNALQVAVVIASSR